MEKRFFEFYEINHKGYINSSCKECEKPITKAIFHSENNIHNTECYMQNGGILTMAFVNMQPLESVYPEKTAFCNGTLFPDLNKPFFGGNKR